MEVIIGKGLGKDVEHEEVGVKEIERKEDVWVACIVLEKCVI